MLTHQFATPTKPARVVVLGGTGFVGRDVLRELAARGIETVGMGSTGIDLCSPDAGDALRNLVRGDDALVMVSALTPDRGKDARTLLRNLTMGESLSTFLQHPRCAQVVYISSDAVYADGVSLIRETTCTSPTTFHGLMHLARERMLAQALGPSGVPFLVLRPCALYGAQDPHNGYGPNRFVRSAIRERTIALFGEGEEQRDHVYIEDLSRLIGLCLTRRSAGILNVASGCSVPFREVAEQVASLCEEPVRIEAHPRQGPITHRHMDPAALVRAFPSFQTTSLSRGLAETFSRMGEAEAAMPRA